MSAPQIPNLLTSRGAPRSRGRVRGRGGGGGGTSLSHHDQTIQATDTDAAVSRLSAVSLGYLHDPYAKCFVNGPGTRRLPIINRGTFARTRALDLLIHNFLSHPSNITQTKQIISLGAGTDTRYFRLRAAQNQQQHRDLIYHEFDFPSVCNAKYHIVNSNPHLLYGEEKVFRASDHPLSDNPEEAVAEWGFQTADSEERYFCHPVDLRNLPSRESLSSFPGVRSDIPTLIISECCLCYLPVEAARQVVEWFRDRIEWLGIVLYEPVGVDDAFGKMMVDNLRARGIEMPTVERYKTIGEQRERLKDLGFGAGQGAVGAVTIQEVWERWITDGERERVDSLEGLDEIEEWAMLAQHYAVVWGWKGDIGFEGWKEILAGGSSLGV